MYHITWFLLVLFVSSGMTSNSLMLGWFKSNCCKLLQDNFLFLDHFTQPTFITQNKDQLLSQNYSIPFQPSCFVGCSGIIIFKGSDKGHLCIRKDARKCKQCFGRYTAQWFGGWPEVTVSDLENIQSVFTMVITILTM